MKIASVVASTVIINATFFIGCAYGSVAEPSGVVAVSAEMAATSTSSREKTAETSPETKPETTESSDQLKAQEAAEAAIKNYLAMIDVLEAEGNSFDVRLAESSLGLGIALQQSGQHQEAISAFRRAMQITRINDGLYSISQEPMLRGMIESEKAIRDIDAASTHYQHLVWLNGKSRDLKDPQMISLLDEISQWHLDAYKLEPGRSSVGHLLASYNLSLDAIDMAASSFGPTNLRIIPLLKSVISSSYYMARHQLLYPDNMTEEPTFTVSYQSPVARDTESPEKKILASSYSSGREAHQRIIEILNTNLGSNRDKAEAYAELGDWHMLFGRRSAANRAYQEANLIISADSNSATLAAELFGEPKMLPINMGSTGNERNTSGAILVEFDVLASGTARNINILDADEESSARSQATARDVLRDAKFRPAFVDGEPTDFRGVKLKVRIAEG